MTRDFELKIELLDACNARCSFCHQGVRRPLRTARMSRDVGLHWIGWAARNNIPSIRFSGGEPTLHPDLAVFCAAAYAEGLDVAINTNGLVETALLDALAPTVRTLKISIPVADSVRLDALTGMHAGLATKIRTARLAMELGFEIEILTALLPENIGRLDAFVALLEGLPGARWVPLRLESSPTAPRPLTREELQQLAEEIDRLMRRYPGRIPGIRLATPFCAVDPIELGARVLSGRAEDCGPFRSLTVEPTGQLVSCYSCRVPIRQIDSMENVDRDPEVIRLRSIDVLQPRCRSCEYAARCMGGCASDHARAQSEGSSIDYLAVRHAT